ncbi:GTP-binding protein [Cupriavidus sp. IK-TO18]|uniref:CobW family GTP-binding protein n=1 Tax=Cupriavidus sp. IK-TO18 TaxID=2782182 RepID=UPI0018985F81|nr:GTP-binding protein [Cupriavidus sp. IK-TO18]MBF6991519.1 GTP-binding protein [Cupriavidus sp. IK-TO18]
MNARPPIPLVVVGGYLGAGKTTLLNRLLANAQGLRIAVLVNDFGEINIDAALIRTRSDDVIQLENGCVCCSIGGRLAEALLAIADRDVRPDLLVIEASGVSDPQRIAQIGLLDPAFRLNAVLVAVDAAAVHDSLRDPLVGEMVRQQIAGASVVALTKTDLCAAGSAAATVGTISTLAPRATVLEACDGDLPLSVFVDAAMTTPASTGVLQAHAGWPRPAPHAGIRSFAYQTGRSFDKARLRQALLSLPVRLLRAKGLVRLAADPRLHEVHVVGGRMRMRSMPHGDAGEFGEFALVFIGAFDAAGADAISASMESALA